MDSRRIIDRLSEYAAYKGYTFNKMTVDCGLSIGILGKAMRGNFDVGRVTLERILATYTDLNREWLIVGVGSMLNGAAPQEEAPQEPREDVEALKAEIASLKEIVARLTETNARLTETNNKLTERLLQ